jgi:clan AA aspartic protease (TIGR02281 family)
MRHREPGLYVLILLFFPFAVTAQEVRLEAGPNGTFRTYIVIEDQVGGTALIDTGASSVLLCTETAKSLGLDLGDETELETVNSRVSVRRAQIRFIRIGAIKIADVAALVQTGADCGEILLGMSAIAKLGAAVFRGRTLTLIAAKARLRRSRNIRK